MTHHHARGRRRTPRREPLDIARYFDEQPDIEFVDRMVALYREHFDGPSASERTR